MELCDAILYAALDGEEGEELIITGEISKLSNNKKSVDIFDPKDKDCDTSVYLKKQAPKDCKVGSVATVQGKLKIDVDILFDGLTNSTIKCTAATPAQVKDFRQLTRDEVLMVQTFLYDYQGYVVQGPPDGIMSEQTRIALAKAQKDAGFNVTGELTKDQFDLIRETMKKPPPERQWAAISVATSVENAYVILSKVNMGSKAYRDAEAQCREKYKSGDCVTGVTYGTASEPNWVAGMRCDWKGNSRPFVSFGNTEQDAFDRIVKEIEKVGILLESCKRVASIKSDGTS